MAMASFMICHIDFFFFLSPKVSPYVEIILIIADIELMDNVFNKLIEDEEEFVKTITRHVASGGTLPQLCETLGVRYGDVVHWLLLDKENRYKMFAEAQNSRVEWAKEEIFSELKTLSKSRIVDFFDDKGVIKKPSDWTPEMKALVKEIKFDDNGEIKEVKFWNKEKALELLGKNMEMFTDKHSTEVKLKLEDLIQVKAPDEQ